MPWEDTLAISQQLMEVIEQDLTDKGPVKRLNSEESSLELSLEPK